jgi:hypothetical protein
MQRPTSLTVIGWVLIVFGAFGLIGTAMLPGNPMVVDVLKDSPLPLSAHIAIGAIGGSVSLACGYGVLKGLAWSRPAYVAWCIVGIALSLYSMPFNSFMLLSWGIQAVIIYFLYRPEAIAWFGGDAAASE